jgi:glycogen debranching enzyme
MSNELLLLHPAVYHDSILQYASALRHGTIPNLLDFANNPRYNCRDACWWFVRGVKEYARLTKDYDIFKTKVDMVFLSNDMLEHKEKLRKGEKKVMLVEEIIQTIFQSHADGITYR